MNIYFCYYYCLNYENFSCPACRLRQRQLPQEYALGINEFTKHYLRRTANVRPLSFIFILYRLNLAQFIVWNRIDSSTYVHESSYNISRQVIDTCTKNLNNLNRSLPFGHFLTCFRRRYRRCGLELAAVRITYGRPILNSSPSLFPRTWFEG